MCFSLYVLVCIFASVRREWVPGGWGVGGGGGRGGKGEGGVLRSFLMSVPKELLCVRVSCGYLCFLKCHVSSFNFLVSSAPRSKVPRFFRFHDFCFQQKAIGVCQERFGWRRAGGARRIGGVALTTHTHAC